MKNVFLYGDLNEEVYMEQLPGYIAQEKMVCKLRKTIYGLKQSLRAWFDKLSKIMFSTDFTRYNSDHSIFMRNKITGTVILTVYINDILNKK